MRVASKAGNLYSEFWHARPLDSRVIRYVRDARTDGQKQSLLPTSLRTYDGAVVPQSQPMLYRFETFVYAVVKTTIDLSTIALAATHEQIY